MKAIRISLGLAAGLATGLSVALLNRNTNDTSVHTTSSENTSDITQELDIIKQQINNIMNYAVTAKNEGAQLSRSISHDLKSSIGTFKADINPNVQRLQKYIENLQNRGEELTNFPTKK
ncbi:YtxH domain-containing protein [Staphylococcus sp. 17KM0847]|uniref:YtxH domain-containing protein n=1 Tax=Staphylococcus sp. 17KM0847 TaxID=2583989 RepID=UPI0015DCF007|nr:YtxH domain-containing protein [Staphylococcus sp. 17KM0847]QLK86337.1 YtxH domain-containing protein [Staphylococcus sp. 17KM0847]